MKTPAIILLSGLAVLASASTTLAGRLVTPPLSRGDGNNFNCRAVNASGKEIKEYRIEIRGSSNQLRNSTTGVDWRPGYTKEVTENPPMAISYCVIDGKGISSRKLRVSFCTRTDANPIACVTVP